MKFPVYVTCGYPSYKEAGIEWADLEYKAWKLVKAIKGQPVSGYALFGQHRVDETPTGRATARHLAAGDAVQKLRGAGIVAPLVPIPASDHVEFGATFVGEQLARAITMLAPEFDTRPVLKFDQPMPKSSGGGTRDPGVIAAALRLDPCNGLNECVLLDDVTTSGGHLRGAARFLENHGITVVGAYCVAQTVWTRPAHLFRIPSAELDSTPDWFEL